MTGDTGDPTPRRVEIPPYEIFPRAEVDPGTTALVIVDLLRDFVSDHGHMPLVGAAAIVPRVRRLQIWARRVGMAVVFARDTHRDGDPDWTVWGRHAEEGSAGWRIVDEVAPRDSELVVPKLRADAFYSTALDHELRLRGVDTLILCGLDVHGSLTATAMSAGARWYRLVLPVDAVATEAELDREALLRLTGYLHQGVLTTTDALLSSSPEN